MHPSVRATRGRGSVICIRIHRVSELVTRGSYTAGVIQRDVLYIPQFKRHEHITDPLPLFPFIHYRHRDTVEEFLLGAGANGIAFVEGPKVSMAFEGDIAVYFQGDTHREISDSFESHAHEILARYRDRDETGDGELGFLSGEFSVVVFDKLAGCVLAARDPNGAEPLFWGTSNFGNSLLFSTDSGLLSKQCTDADTFPAGTVFCSKCGEITGELTMLNMFGGWDGEGNEYDDSDDESVDDFLVEDFKNKNAPESPAHPPARLSEQSTKTTINDDYHTGAA